MRRSRALLAAAAFVAAGLSPAPAAPVEVRPIDAAQYARLVASAKGTVLVVNMWATWCAPCREEFPELVRFDREMRPRRVRIVAISMDAPSDLESEVVPFLEAQGAAFHVYIKARGDDDRFINGIDPEWSGALPATFVYDTEGRLARSLIGPITFDRLRDAVAPFLASTPD